MVPGEKRGTEILDNKPADYVKSLAKGIHMLEILNEEMKPMTLTDVAHKAGVTRATARRFLLTYESLGYLKSEGRLFQLTPRVLSLSSAFLGNTSLSAIATPYLQTFTDNTGESSSLTILDGDYIVYLARVPAKRIMSINIHVGSRLPALYTSMGRAIIARQEEQRIVEMIDSVELEALTKKTTTDKKKLLREMSKIKKQGYALVNQELELGLCSLAVPVINNGTAVAAINVACSAAVYSPDKMIRNFLPELQKAAQGMQLLIQ